MEFLSEMGYKAGAEVKLKIDPAFHPIPDVIATRWRVEQPYPTKALEVVIEILSEDDPISRVLTKCRAYQSWGFEQIYVVDPQARIVFCWVENRLEEVCQLASIAVERIWLALGEELK